MKEQLVSFKVAKLAKEKGFNEECLHFYCKNNTSNYLKTPYKYSYEVDANQENFINGRLDNFGYGQTWSAPTQSFLQKWLREEYGMDIYIEALLEKQTKDRRYSPVLVYFQEDLRVILRKNFSKSGFFYIVYEKALDDILEEALKLIDNESTKESI